MARSPSTPKTAPTAPAESEAEPAEAPASKPSESEGRSDDARRRKHLMAGAAIGIGSAAIVAALLYANRKRDRG
ncbi:MAG TPA: hypothetical protein VFW19_02760 [Allosphingosinicella sp.]|nr:hypothetical protein [Allosphingosinicella sp.]